MEVLMKDREVRRIQNTKIIKKRLKLVKMVAPEMLEKLKEEPGRLRKKHPLDCGHPKCINCHYDKVLNKPKISDKKKIISTEDDY
jgi:hypothetical protein